MAGVAASSCGKALLRRPCASPNVAVDLPPQAEVEGEVGPHLEVILNEGGHVIRAEVFCQVSGNAIAQEDITVRAAVLRAALPKQEVGEGKKFNFTPARTIIGEIELLPLKLVAGADVVPAMRPGNLIGCLVRVHHRIGKVIEAATQAEQP